MQSPPDRHADAGWIEVEAGDFYGTGSLPAASRQSVLIDYEWTTDGQD